MPAFNRGWVKKGDIELLSFFSVVGMVIVERDGGDKFLPEDLPYRVRKRSLAGDAVTSDANRENDRRSPDDLLKIR